MTTDEYGKFKLSGLDLGEYIISEKLAPDYFLEGKNLKFELKLEYDGDKKEITVENTGFYNTIAQKIFKKPRYSFIKLDEYGSFVWQQIDGKKSIYEIGKELGNKHKGASDQLYERLSKYFGILERNKYIVFEK